MNILEKFNSVEVTADTRISEDDRRFCQAQKEAYDHARKSLKFMEERATVFLNEQTSLLAPVEGEVHSTYLGKFDPKDFTETLHNSHKRFIANIVRYFRSRYNVTIKEYPIEEVVLPQKPKERGWSYVPEEWSAYQRSLDELSLEYTDILDQIFIQLGGYSFQDKAVQELKEASHNAAWSSYNGTKRYEQKKAVLTFSGCACSFDSWHEKWYHGEHQIQLSDSTKNIIRSILYFEYGTINSGCTPLDKLLGYNWTTEETELQVNMEKLKSVKCFKNGRVDFRFTSEAYAREFAEQFL